MGDPRGPTPDSATTKHGIGGKRVNALARLKSSWVVIKLSVSREPYKSQKLGTQVIGTLPQGKHPPQYS